MRRALALLVPLALLAATFPAGADLAFEDHDGTGTDTYANPAVVEADGVAYLVGGSVAGQPTAAVRFWNATSGLAESAGSLYQAVADPAAAYAHGVIHVFGGQDVQGFDPLAGYGWPVGRLPRALAGPASAAHLPGTEGFFLLVGAGTATKDGAGTEVWVVNDQDTAGMTTNGTLPFLAGHPPLVATPSGLWLFHEHDVLRLDPANATYATWAPSEVAIGNGSAVWDGSRVLVFDDRGQVAAFDPEDPTRGARPVEHAPHLVDGTARAALLPDGRSLVAYGDAGTVWTWTPPAFDPLLDVRCGGTLVCALDLATWSTPLGLDVRMTVAGLGTFDGGNVTVRFPAEGSYAVHVEATDPLGRAFAHDTYASVHLDPPYAAFRFDCSFGNRTCRFDAGDAHDYDGGSIASYRWAVPSAGLAATGPVAWIAFPDEREHDVVLRVADNVGLEGSAQRRVNATGTPAIERFEATCHGLRCWFDTQASDDADAHLLAYEPLLGSTVPASACESWSYGYLECLFPKNGTYRVGIRVGDPGGNATERHRDVRVANLAPMAYAWPHCGDAAPYRCQSNAAYAWDPEGTNVTLRWEPEPGTLLDGPALDWNFTTGGLKLVRLHLADEQGMSATETYPLVLGDLHRVSFAAAVRPSGSAWGSLVVHVDVHAEPGLAYEEAFMVRATPVGQAAQSGSGHAVHAVAMATTGMLAAEVALPPLAAGLYRIEVEGVAGGGTEQALVEVTSFWA